MPVIKNTHFAKDWSHQDRSIVSTRVSIYGKQLYINLRFPFYI